LSGIEKYKERLNGIQDLLGYTFKDPQLLLSALTHPSALEGRSNQQSYERLEFLGDSILGAIVADRAFHAYQSLDEGGLTRIKVSLVSGSSLSKTAEELGFADYIIFGSSETGTGKRGLHSALENVYESIVAALYLDGGWKAASEFVDRTLVVKMSLDMAKEPENPKSVLQERLQEDGITPTYRLVETQGPPHNRTFVTQVFVGVESIAKGVGRTKKESESHAAESALKALSSIFEAKDPKEKKRQADAKAAVKAAKAEEKARRRAESARKKKQ
jgi:ribonuclease-3